MGVPKFFRWLSERYPCLCEELKEYQIPEFDNLYLDMNGIIHVCSHPNDFDPHFRISEEQIFTGIFHYIEVLFRLIRPKKLFFMAVDGVAPRAKMNQQRGRRFSSAKEAENLEKKALEKGEALPKEKRFDSNCITPGTHFMAKLQEQLKYFVANKITNDKLWQKPTIILSGHSVPGEGEHKIMDYIRYLRSQPNWDPHTRHCLYGLDADLIILGLCTHEPNFSLLREEVKFVKSSKNKRVATPETINYNLLHLSLLRGYLDLEFQALKNSLPFPYDIEKIIDDWVLMGFLVGNDFIPHLPHLHIHTNALGILYDTYRAVLPKLDGYINENGVLNMARFEKFLIHLSQLDMDSFNETYADMKFLESKTGKKHFPDLSEVEGENADKPRGDKQALNDLIESSNRDLEMFEFDEEDPWEDEALEPGGLETLNLESEEDKMFFREFSNHKRDYYLNKMEYSSVSKDVLQKEAKGYVTALQWILFYYYRGCPSWSWYYPHHYSPYVSDLKGFSSLDVRFEGSKPFLPFQQLLAVLPAASREFLPEGYQSLMTSKESPIIDYYPSDFKFDLNGKRQEWEAVVLIPFIEEKRLLEAMQPFNNQLTDEENFRNSHGPMQIYKYSSSSLGVYKAPKYFPDIQSNRASCVEVYPLDVAVPLERLITGRHPFLNDSEPVYMPGFPVLSALEITGTLEKRGVKVFDYPSRGENMILRIKERPELMKPLLEIADDFLANDYIYVSYPHLMPAKVSMIVSQSETVQVQNSREKRRIEKNNSMAQGIYEKKLNSLKEMHLSKFGIDLSSCRLAVYVHLLEGTKLSFSSSGEGHTDMIWGSEVVGYPLDTCLASVVESDVERKKFKLKIPLDQVFPIGTIAYMLGPVDYGSSVKVMEITPSHHIMIELIKTSEPDFTKISKEILTSSQTYYPGFICGQKLGISNYLFSRITSSILVQSPHTDSDKTNIGLCLKYTKSSQQVVGYTKKEGSHWFYSDKVIQLVREYMDKFPDLFEYLLENTSEDIFFKDKMFPNDSSAARLTEIRNWLKTLEKGELRSTESQLAEPSAVQLLEKFMSDYTEENLELKVIKLMPHHLYLPKPDLMVSAPDPEAEHCLYDRIIYVRECHSIPIGIKGTIIGIEKKKSLVCEGSGWEEAATLYDVLFDQEIIGGQALFGCLKKQVYRLNKQVFINLSYGVRKFSSPQNTQHPTPTKQLNAHSNRRAPPSNQRGNNRDNPNRDNPKRNSNQFVNTMMPVFGGPPSGANQLARNQPNTTSANGDQIQNKPSGSVTNFFKAYKSNANNNEDRSQLGAMMAGNLQIANVNVASNPPAPMTTMNDPGALSDMWNLLKNLQVKNNEGTEVDTQNVGSSGGIQNVGNSGVMQNLGNSGIQNVGNSGIQNVGNSGKQNVIMSQTFTRSSSSQQISQDDVSQRDARQRSGNTAPRPLSLQYPEPNSSLQNRPPIQHPTHSNPFVEQTEALKKILCIKPTGNMSNLENNNLESMENVGSHQTVDLRNQSDQVNDGVKEKRWSAPPVHTSGIQQFSGGRGPSRPCGHLPSCWMFFYKLCPLYMIDNLDNWVKTSKDGVVVHCRLPDGFEFCGSAKKIAVEAQESMACKGISILTERYGPPTTDQNRLYHARRNMGMHQMPIPIQMLNSRVQGGIPPVAPGFDTPRAAHSGSINVPPPLMSDSVMAQVQNRVVAQHDYQDSRHQQPVIAHNQQKSKDERQGDGRSKKRNKRKVKIAANFNHPIKPN